ncbi:PHP domain-containing protein [Chloroflexi bacterium]|nr:PHP domain-containing protein [Chloroflexota bacterium]
MNLECIGCHRGLHLFNFDLHVHTVKGSTDSGLLPDQLIAEAKRIGLNGVFLSEHGGGWNADQIKLEFGESNLTVTTGLEVNTDMGHIIVVGLDSYVSGIHKLKILREKVDEVGGVLIAAHPLRNFFNRPPYNVNLLYGDWKTPPETPEQAAEHELFSLVDCIEVTNGANSEKENEFTLEIANYLGKPATGGSDSHSDQGIGKSYTVFENEILDRETLIAEIKANRFYPAEGLNTGNIKDFRLSDS